MNNELSRPEPDLFRLLGQWKKGRRAVLFSALAGALLGTTAGLCLPERFTATAKMVAETGQPGLSPEISGITSLVGINLGTLARENELDAALYPEIIASTPFLAEMERVRVDGVSLSSFIPGFGRADEAPSDPRRVHALHRLMRRSFRIETDKKSGLITVSVALNDPQAAAVAADSLTAKLERYVIAHRIRKAQNDFSFVGRQFEEAKQRYYTAQHEYARHTDANRHTVRQSAEVERNRLYQEQQLAHTVYSQLAGQFETARLKVQEQTPVFTVIEPTQIPVFRSFPPRIAFMLGGLAVGAILAGLFIAVRFVFNEKNR